MLLSNNVDILYEHKFYRNTSALQWFNIVLKNLLNQRDDRQFDKENSLISMSDINVRNKIWTRFQLYRSCEAGRWSRRVTHLPYSTNSCWNVYVKIQQLWRLSIQMKVQSENKSLEVDNVKIKYMQITQRLTVSMFMIGWTPPEP